MDKASGKHKGTAFVEFLTTEGAKKASDACARGRCALSPFYVFVCACTVAASTTIHVCVYQANEGVCSMRVMYKTLLLYVCCVLG